MRSKNLTYNNEKIHSGSWNARINQIVGNISEEEANEDIAAARLSRYARRAKQRAIDEDIKEERRELYRGIAMPLFGINFKQSDGGE